MNDALKRWKLRGHVYLWRYEDGVGVRNYPGWHLTADSAGCASVLELIELMLASPFASRASVLLTPPDERELSVPNAGLRHTPAASLELYHSPTKLPPNHWNLVSDDDRVRLEVGRDALVKLRRGITDVAQHQGDYCIGEDGQELWFWWLTEPSAHRR